jgi:hypothetical protein
MDDRVLPQPRDLVLDGQFAPLEFRNLQTVCRRVCLCLAYFLFQRPVPSFEFGKMRLHRHLAASLRLMTPAPLSGMLHKYDRVQIYSFCRTAKIPAVHDLAVGLSGINQNAIIHSDLPAFSPCPRGAQRDQGATKAAMTKEEERELRAQLSRLQQEHRDLDAAIAALQGSLGSDIIQVQRLKKRKLHLRDRITFIEDQLTPDIIA